jgi:catalase
VQPKDEADTASTLSEDNESAKLGDGMARTGFNATNDSLDRVRVDSGGQPLTPIRACGSATTRTR